MFRKPGSQWDALPYSSTHEAIRSIQSNPCCMLKRAQDIRATYQLKYCITNTKLARFDHVLLYTRAVSLSDQLRVQIQTSAQEILFATYWLGNYSCHVCSALFQILHQGNMTTYFDIVKSNSYVQCQVFTLNICYPIPLMIARVNSRNYTNT